MQEAKAKAYDEIDKLDVKWDNSEEDNKLIEQRDELNNIIEENTGEDVIYWRKANMIQGWMNNNVNYQENCSEEEVSLEQLIELKDLCQYVINHPETAEDKLPVEQGFFYGSYDYDEYYFGYLEQTIKDIQSVLDTHQEGDLYFYSAWW